MAYQIDRADYCSEAGALGTFRNFAGQSRKGGGEGQGRRPLSCDIRKVIFIGNAGNDQSLGQVALDGRCAEPTLDPNLGKVVVQPLTTSLT